MELTGKRVAVLVEQMYQELEVWYPIYRLKEASAIVTTIGPDAGKTYASKLGYPVKSDRAASEVRADDFDALVIPGGFAPDYIRRSEAMLNLVRTMIEQNKPVAAICHGPWVLCSTTALRGRKVTGFRSIRDDLVNAGAIFEDAAVVIDRNIITSRTPDDLPAFMQAIIAAIAKH